QRGANRGFRTAEHACGVGIEGPFAPRARRHLALARAGFDAVPEEPPFKGMDAYVRVRDGVRIDQTADDQASADDPALSVGAIFGEQLGNGTRPESLDLCDQPTKRLVGGARLPEPCVIRLSRLGYRR